uniref:Unannotated protein n=1 Tax=freshwater metagenome TaxID=449393 RepID=A0A6J7NQF0_9ZZZZ
MKTRRSRLAIMGSVVVAAALVLTACFTANLSGSGSTGSAIQPYKKLEFALKSNDSLGLGIGGSTGKLKDSGKNVLFPKGVNISFNNGLVAGFGGDCTDGLGLIGGAPRAVHISGGGGTGPSGPPGFCDLYSDPREWFGVVTYSSADPRRYPNQGFEPCNDYYEFYLSIYLSIFLSAFSGGGPVRPVPRLSASQQQNISGFGIAVVIDTNYNRNYDKGDRVSFVPVCGPYTHIEAPPSAPILQSVNLAGAKMPAGLGSALERAVAKAPAFPRSEPASNQYNYITCGYNSPLILDPLFGATGAFDELFGDSGLFGSSGSFGLVPGAISSDFIDDSPMVPLMLAYLCAGKVSSGDVKIGIATRLTTTTTSTTSTTEPTTTGA